MQKYLLDTNTIIYALNKGYRFPNNRYLVSVISEIELLSFSKLTKQEEEILKRALSKFESIELHARVKEESIKLRKETKIKLPDCIIIATAIVEKAILVTSDKQLLNSQIVQTISLEQL
jgi:predicted nucleic acid-binding protein